MNISNSDLSNNTAPSISALYLSGLGGNYNYITSSRFSNNTSSSGGVIYLSSTYLIITSSIFSENSSPNSDYSGIFSTASILFIQSNQFQLQTATYAGGFVYAQSSSVVNISLSVFSNGNAVGIGGSIFIDSGILAINSSDFGNNWVSFQGGSIYSLSSAVTLFNSTFHSSTAYTGDAVYLYGGQLSANFCTFSSSKNAYSSLSASVYAEINASISLTSCSFRDSVNPVGGVLAYDAPTVSVKNCTFENFNILLYGALSLIGTTTYGKTTITDSVFRSNNSTGSGAAIHSENMNFTLSGGSISLNTAEVDGGGLYLTSPLCTSCQFSISGAAYIFKNTCSNEGGAIKWLNYKPSIENSSLIYNNTAPYGSDLASRAATLNFFNFRRSLASTSIGYISDVAPGQSYTGVITVYLYDSYGNIVVTDDTSSITISAMANTNYSVLGNTSFTASKGKFTIANFIPSGLIGTNMSLVLSTSGIDTSKVANNNNTYSNTATVTLALRNCTYGEQVNAYSCIVCAAPTYAIYPVISCSTCPQAPLVGVGPSFIPPPATGDPRSFQVLFTHARSPRPVWAGMPLMG